MINNEENGVTSATSVNRDKIKLKKLDLSVFNLQISFTDSLMKEGVQARLNLPCRLLRFITMIYSICYRMRESERNMK